MKELINNSYDADASKVRVFVKPDADQIIIEDDGVGLSKDEFLAHFSRISESHKRDASQLSPSGRRPQIGKIGIGFIAANEICDTMEIYSSKKGTTRVLHVIVNFAEMRRDPALRRTATGDIAKADFEGEELPNESKLDESFTQVFLTNVRDLAQPILVGARKAARGRVGGRSLYGLKPTSIRRILADPTLDSWSDLDFYSETMLRVGLNVPVTYLSDWVPSRLHPKTKEFEDGIEHLRFSVEYDGTQLHKPIVLDPHGGRCLVRTFDLKGDRLNARGYFYAQHGVIKPNNLNGLLIRIRQAAVGEYDRSFMGYPTSQGTLFQRWISSEIWASDELEDAMNIDRRTFRITHPTYVELQNAIHAQLDTVLKNVRETVYAEGVAERSTRRAAQEMQRLEVFASDPAIQVRPSIRKQVVQSFQKPNGEVLEKQLLRRFTVSELYRLVVDVASELLTPDQLRTFLNRLTERLTQSRRR